MEVQDALYTLRHSAAHLLAQAVLELYPGTKLTIGPVTENGFFYDFLPTKNFKEEDLSKIEKRMRELAKKDFQITGGQVSKKEARPLFKDNQFKLELIDDIQDDTVGVYYQGDFYDLCKGGHVQSTGKVKHFKLMNISGAYWRADRSGQPLQRISGVAFLTKEDLDAYLKRLEEVKHYDHRRLGKQLDLFSFHEEAAGMPFFHQKGCIIYNQLITYMRRMLRDDYQEIKTPLIMHEELWKQSGHYDHYKDNMFFTQIDEISHCVRPMNCPSAFLLYRERPHSYRELPLRMSEYGLVHRNELSGVLHGLFRVRAFTLDDAHIFCTEDQIESEVIKLLELAQEVYARFDFKKIDMALATKPEQAMGADELWEKAIKALKNALDTQKASYIVEEGEGAFYGPKIDISIEDAMGRKWQCGTIQIDFNGPINFNLTYIDSDQSRKKPVVIHRAIYGSIERFLGIVLEHYKGQLPFWLSPLQARVLVITDEQRDYAKKVVTQLREKAFRVEIDESGDQIGAQIRRSQLDKVPWMLVIGKKEQQKETVMLRHHDGKQEFDLTIDDLIAKASILNGAIS